LQKQENTEYKKISKDAFKRDFFSEGKDLKGLKR